MRDFMERELGWEDEISQDSQEWTLLEDGDYVFEVIKVERARYKGSDKIPPCNMAVVTLRVNDTVNLQEKLKLHTKVEWLLCQFFASVGLRQRGEPLRMNWSAVVGQHGICQIGHRTWTGNDGKERSTNQVEKFYYPDEAPNLLAQAAQTAQTAQAFPAPSQAQGDQAQIPGFQPPRSHHPAYTRGSF